MKTPLTLLIALSLILLFAVAPVMAAPTPGGCPDDFTLVSTTHDHTSHGHDHGHQHVGNDTNQNGDGWICGKHVGKKGNIHVHIDNNASNG